MLGAIVFVLVVAAFAYFMLRNRPRRRSNGPSFSVTVEAVPAAKGLPFKMIRQPPSAVLELPPLQGAYRGPHKAASTSQPGVKHDVDLTTLTCSCEGFQKHCIGYGPRDLRRVDRHIARVLIWTKAIQEFDELTQVLLGYEKDPRVASSGFEGCGADYIHKLTLSSGTDVVLSFSTNRPWVNVTTRRLKKTDTNDFYTGPYSRYGYNIVEDRWSFGGTPPGAKLISKEIQNLFDFEGTIY